MRKLAIIFHLLFVCLISFAQGNDSVQIIYTASHTKTYSWNTKYEYLTNKRNSSYRIFDEGREPFSAEVHHRIRGVIHDNDTTFFVTVNSVNVWEFIEENDVLKMLEKLETMIPQYHIDLANNDIPYFENWYTTEDGTKIGYVIDRALRKSWMLYSHRGDLLLTIDNKDITRFRDMLKDDSEEIRNIRKGKIKASVIHALPTRISAKHK